MSTLQEKITNKENQIKKLVAKFDKYSKLVSEEFLSLINQFLRTGDRTNIREYTKTHSRWNYLEGSDYDLYHTASDLYDARKTLEKYNKQLKAETDKQSTLNELPAVIVEFKNQLITRWDEFDMWKREQIKLEYDNRSIDYDTRRRNLNNKWGRGWYDFMYISDSKIHKNNVRDADNLILNMINRVIEKTGKITDASGLYTDRDNSGYTIINGKIIGETGTAKIESIGAGGYNIMRYHIRVLVK